jgi:hypothetical protein
MNLVPSTHFKVLLIAAGLLSQGALAQSDIDVIDALLSPDRALIAQERSLRRTFFELMESTQCEKALVLVDTWPGAQRPDFSLTECRLERKFREVLRSRSAQEMYVAAGSFERQDGRLRATKIYETIVDRFPGSDFAVKANDRLLNILERERRESAQRSAEVSARNVKEEASSGCYARISACNNSCPNIKFNPHSAVYACNERCRSICTP